jgi:hypothetical protein
MATDTNFSLAEGEAVDVPDDFVVGGNLLIGLECWREDGHFPGIHVLAGKCYAGCSYGLVPGVQATVTFMYFFFASLIPNRTTMALSLRVVSTHLCSGGSSLDRLYTFQPFSVVTP